MSRKLRLVFCEKNRVIADFSELVTIGQNKYWIIKLSSKMAGFLDESTLSIGIKCWQIVQNSGIIGRKLNSGGN